MINIKDLYKIFQEAGKIEEYEKIIKLQDDSFRNRERIEELLMENKELRERLTVAGEIKLQNNAYYIGERGPFCMHCYDDERKLITLPERPGFETLHCPKCKNYFAQGRSSSIRVLRTKPTSFE